MFLRRKDFISDKIDYHILEIYEIIYPSYFAKNL